jgi:hypothetical protein
MDWNGGIYGAPEQSTPRYPLACVWAVGRRSQSVGVRACQQKFSASFFCPRGRAPNRVDEEISPSALVLLGQCLRDSSTGAPETAARYARRAGHPLKTRVPLAPASPRADIAGQRPTRELGEAVAERARGRARALTSTSLGNRAVILANFRQAP